ncbi:hypothetical protein chiPu_0013685 [Chiloscyllium punctatum]|uniref:Uncharacterized protein n=1 Tax=Chiloscyllium punctatum TaxID=137246 RepID=A0A401SXS0_CHIPU|nr:hypothetical protein [Chiloscyllium punctatum]
MRLYVKRSCEHCSVLHCRRLYVKPVCWGESCCFTRAKPFSAWGRNESSFLVATVIFSDFPHFKPAAVSWLHICLVVIIKQFA